MLVPFQRKYLPFDDASSSAAIREWFNSEAGLTVVRSAVAKVESLLPNLFGYHLAIFADYIDRDLISSSRISHQITAEDQHECRVQDNQNGKGQPPW